MSSVRARAAFGATAVVALALAVAGWLMLTTLRANLDEQVALQAEVTGRDVAAQLATGTGFQELELDVAGGPVQVTDARGRTRAASPGLEGMDSAVLAHGVERVLPRATRDAAGEGTEESEDGEGGEDDEDEDDDEEERVTPGPGEVAGGFVTETGTAVLDGREGEYLFVVIQATTPLGQEVTVYAGAPMELERAAVDSVRTSMATGLPVLLAVVALVTWLVTRRALRPVEGIRREMAAITRSGDLSLRVPEPASRDEVGRLARTTNETLAALESSVERQRRFVADASHELRSPIASLRTQLEVGEAHPELLDVPGAVQDTVRLQDLAADLLLLARLDAGERPAAGTVDLAGLVVEELGRRAADRVPVRAGEPDGVPDDAVEVAGSRGQLVRVLGNLLDNAQRHAGSAVRVSVRQEDGADGCQVAVEVADDGEGVPEADRERIFQRFVRLDDARSRDEGGAGLGLAIARDVALRHGGTLTAGEAPEGGALFVLRLPATAPVPGAAD